MSLKSPNTPSSLDKAVFNSISFLKRFLQERSVILTGENQMTEQQKENFEKTTSYLYHSPLEYEECVSSRIDAEQQNQQDQTFSEQEQQFGDIAIKTARITSPKYYIHHSDLKTSSLYDDKNPQSQSSSSGSGSQRSNHIKQEYIDIYQPQNSTQQKPAQQQIGLSRQECQHQFKEDQQQDNICQSYEKMIRTQSFYTNAQQYQKKQQIQQQIKQQQVQQQLQQTQQYFNQQQQKEYQNSSMNSRKQHNRKDIYSNPHLSPDVLDDQTPIQEIKGLSIYDNDSSVQIDIHPFELQTATFSSSSTSSFVTNIEQQYTQQLRTQSMNTDLQRICQKQPDIDKELNSKIKQADQDIKDILDKMVMLEQKMKKEQDIGLGKDKILEQEVRTGVEVILRPQNNEEFRKLKSFEKQNTLEDYNNNQYKQEQLMNEDEDDDLKKMKQTNQDKSDQSKKQRDESFQKEHIHGIASFRGKTVINNNVNQGKSDSREYNNAIVQIEDQKHIEIQEISKCKNCDDQKAELIKSKETIINIRKQNRQQINDLKKQHQNELLQQKQDLLNKQESERKKCQQELQSKEEEIQTIQLLIQNDIDYSSIGTERDHKERNLIDYEQQINILKKQYDDNIKIINDQKTQEMEFLEMRVKELSEQLEEKGKKLKFAETKLSSLELTQLAKVKSNILINAAENKENFNSANFPERHLRSRSNNGSDNTQNSHKDRKNAQISLYQMQQNQQNPHQLSLEQYAKCIKPNENLPPKHKIFLKKSSQKVNQSNEHKRLSQQEQEQKGRNLNNNNLNSTTNGSAEDVESQLNHSRYSFDSESNIYSTKNNRSFMSSESRNLDSYSHPVISQVIIPRPQSTWNYEETLVQDEDDDGLKNSIKNLIAKVKSINSNTTLR